MGTREVVKSHSEAFPVIKILIKRPRKPRVFRPYLSQGQGDCGHCEGCMAAFQDQVDNERPGHAWRVKNGKVVYMEDDIIESHRGRKLDVTEQIIHKNGNVLDNRLENLEIVKVERLEE